MLIKIIPKSQRAKNRVREHGEIMEKIPDATNSTFRGEKAHLLKSIKENDEWVGWITYEEASFEVVK